MFINAIAATLLAATASPQVVWTFEAQSNLYAPPLVAEICPNPGLETIISDSDVRTLRCIDAKGRQIWQYKGGWKKRLTSSAALSFTARGGLPTLAIGNSDGTLACIDAATGAELWKKPVGKMEWGGALWADLDGDGTDEILAGAENSGVFALTADGKVLWNYTTPENDKPLIRCPLAAADTDGDGKAEIFAVEKSGPFCLNPDGSLLWKSRVSDNFFSSPVVADVYGDGRPVLFCASTDPDALWAFDARNGNVQSSASLAGDTGAYSGSSLAIGDIDCDGMLEVLAPTDAGYVYCFDNSLNVKWVFPTQCRVHAALSCGDIDGDGEIETLVASGDHNLYCIDNRGVEKWRYEAGLRLINSPTITDIDNDAISDILFCGSDKKLRCLTVGGAYAPGRIPWPSRRFDPAQSGSSFGKIRPAQMVTLERPLPLNGGFEQRKPSDGSPAGWLLPVSSRPSDTAVNEPFEGEYCLSVTNRGGFAQAASELIEIEPGLRAIHVKAAMMPIRSREAGLEVSWFGLNGRISKDMLFLPAAKLDEWNIIERKLEPPQGVRWFQITCYAHDTPKVLFDAVEVTAVFEVPKAAEVFINQVGYDIGAPKAFNAATNFAAETAPFELVDSEGGVRFSGMLSHQGRITGAYGNDWGSEFWRGDFSEFNMPGTYRIRIRLGGVTALSWPFEIAENLIFNRTARPAYRFFYYQRCGMEIPGFHKACHLDDAIGPDGTQYELWGGWHDAGDYNTYHNAPYVLGLATAFAAGKSRFAAQDEDGNGISDFLDEILWGGQHTRRMLAPDGSAYGSITSGYGFWAAPELETDNIPGTGDERSISAGPGCDSSKHTAALAKIARLLPAGLEREAYAKAGERGLDWALENNKRGPLQFSAAVDLYAATRADRFAVLAKDLLPAANPDMLDTLELYDRLFNENRAAAVKEKILKRADDMLALAQNPFGVYTFGPAEKPNFFGTPPSGDGWHVGTSSHILNAAHTAAQAYKHKPDVRYARFIYDQINWTLGNNPFGVSLMEGAGHRFLPSYHHRYTFSGVPRGAVPGSVVNGVTFTAPGDDRPHLDLSGRDIPDFEPNECWLPHNTAWLQLIANLPLGNN